MSEGVTREATLYDKSDYDLLYARLMNAVNDTNDRLGAPDSDEDREIHNVASLLQKAIGQSLDPDEPLLAATRFLTLGARGPQSGILILLRDRAFAVWDIGSWLVKANVVVVRYDDVVTSSVHWGTGDFDGAVVLEVAGHSEGFTAALVTDDPAKAEFLTDIVEGGAAA